MEINGKKYEVNIDISFGLFEDSQENPDDPKIMKEMLKEILVPAPSDAEIRKMKMSQILEVMGVFADLQEEKNIDYKKKRFLS